MKLQVPASPVPLRPPYLEWTVDEVDPSDPDTRDDPFEDEIDLTDLLEEPVEIEGTH